jgi:glycerol-3-phosphate acyltransferase PlsY
MISILFLFFGYAAGSLPFSIWVTRRVRGVDVRDSGSGHATTTNTIRQAGFGWGALVLVLDIAKGFLPTYIAIRYSGNPWVIAGTAALAVVGHCWPVFAQFRGGMGLATFGGAILALNPIGFLVCLGLLIFFVLVIRHSARASVVTGLLASPALWFLNIRDTTFIFALLGGLVIALRFLIDWNRKYRELWLDREKAEKSSGEENIK